MNKSINSRIRRNYDSKPTIIFVLPPAAPLFVPVGHVSSPHSVYCGQPAASAAEPAIPALTLAAVVAVGRLLDKQKDTTKII